MTTRKHILKEAARIVRTEMPKHMYADIKIKDVEAEHLPGPDCEDYIHVNVILDEAQPNPDAQRLLEFNDAIRPLFERAGVSPIPTISYSNAREFAR